MVVIEFIGRKKTMAMEFVIFGVTITTLLMLCITSRTVLTVILFVSRGVISGVFQAAYVYTPEVYPTHLRSIGVGVCSTMARLGAMVTPFVAQVPTLSIFIHLFLLIECAVITNISIQPIVNLISYFSIGSVPMDHF